jgi:hypothetical protein
MCICEGRGAEVAVEEVVVGRQNAKFNVEQSTKN